MVYTTTCKLRYDMIKPKHIPSPDILQLRYLIRYGTKLTNMITREKTVLRIV